MDRNLGSPPGLWWCGWDGGYSFFCGVWLECSNYYIKVIYLLGCLFLILWFESMSLIGVFPLFLSTPINISGLLAFFASSLGYMKQIYNCQGTHNYAILWFLRSCSLTCSIYLSESNIFFIYSDKGFKLSLPGRISRNKCSPSSWK